MKEKSICQHKWIPLLGRVGKKNITTSLFTCLKCGELKVGTKTIRISRYRLDMDGKPIRNYTVNFAAKTGAYTLTSTDDVVTASGTFTLTLPTASGIAGKSYTITNIGTGIITIDADGTETINGSLTYVIRTTNNGVQLISDGVNWLIKGVF